MPYLGASNALCKDLIEKTPSLDSLHKLKVERIQRDFLWGGVALEKKIHLVNWKSVSSIWENGGLGIKILEMFNKALLSKWLWWFASEDKPLW